MSWFLIWLAVLLAVSRCYRGRPSWVVAVTVGLAGFFFDQVLWLLFAAVAYYLLSERPPRRL